MKYTAEELEKQAVLQVAALMAAAIRTAPKACGVDLGIAIGSAVAIAGEHHIDNRVMFTAGKAAIELGLFSKPTSMAFAIPLSVSKKSIYFDRGSVSTAQPIFPD